MDGFPVNLPVFFYLRGRKKLCTARVRCGGCFSVSCRLQGGWASALCKILHISGCLLCN